MCELLGMSARRPTNLRLSLHELGRHGGETGPHRDGWGVGFVQERDALVVREPAAASDSRHLAFLEDYALDGTIAVAHVRRATQGPRLLQNTQPFVRELGGRAHLFAHNGMLPGIERDARFATRRFRRIGDTDSEHAFCALLERLSDAWAEDAPPLSRRVAIVTEFAAELRTLGPANFLYSDGDVLFAHGHRRRGDSGEIRPPGLHVLCRRCSQPSSDRTDESQEVVLVASVPLTSERWEALAEGQIMLLRGGRIVRAEGHPTDPTLRPDVG
jgi:glutamine amidotransferase